MKKRIFSVLLTIFIFTLLSVPAFAAESPSKLYDGADLLTDSQESELLAELERISKEYKVDVIIATTPSTDGYTPESYTEHFYDSNGYGYGTGRDGVILLISMQDRDYQIISNGLGAKAISIGDIDSIGESISPLLTSEDYSDAFDKFLSMCEYQIDGEINGFPFRFGRNLLICLVIGFVVALIATGVMASKLKTVNKRAGAAEYTKQGSMNLTHSNDLYLYSTVTSVKKQSSSSGSGSSRNSGGGKF